MSSIEEWRPVVGYEGRYEVSTLGRVRRVNGRPLTPFLCGGRKRLQGYRFVFLYAGRRSTRKMFPVHRLVLVAFRGEPQRGAEARHLNGIPDDNRLTNLEWGSPEENYRDQVHHGTAAHGERNGFSVLTKEVVREIRRAYRAGDGSFVALGRRFGVSPATIWRVVSGRGWTSVGDENAA